VCWGGREGGMEPSILSMYVCIGEKGREEL
jgi:hypothetical protein